MSLTIVTQGPDMQVKIAGDLTIVEAAETRDSLALCLTTSETLELDLSDVENIDIAGIQILLSLVKEPRAVQLSAPSPSLKKVLDLLQVSLSQASETC
jgi:anti-anti-sigma factor